MLQCFSAIGFIINKKGEDPKYSERWSFLNPAVKYSIMEASYNNTWCIKAV